LPCGSLRVQTSAFSRSFNSAICSSICLLAAFCFSTWSSSALTYAASGPGGAGSGGGAGNCTATFTIGR
jgi:hypothetical protein